MADLPRKIAPSKALILILSWLLLIPLCAFGQSKPPLGAEQSRQFETAGKTMQEPSDAESLRKSQEALKEFLNEKAAVRRTEPGAAAELEAKFLEFRMAVPKFRTATEEYRWSLSMDSKLEKDLKNLEVQADVLLRYLNAAKVSHPRPETQEFKDYSQKELAWATLSTAERIASFLDLAVVVEGKNVVDAEALEFLYTLDGELRRLKWLTSHTK